MTLTVGAIDTAGDELQTIDINVSDDGVMVAPSITQQQVTSKRAL